MDYRLKLPVKAFWFAVRPVVKLWMRFQMRPIIVDRLPGRIEPPYLIISNHVNVYDGLIATVYSKHLPVPVFDDVQRLNATNRFIFTSMGVVFKAFGIADPVSIRNIVKARDAGRAIMLYPEGEITWTGDSKPLEMNLARLIKLLSIPVILVKAKGAYSKQPKWARAFRGGRCIFESILLLKPEDIKALDDASLLEMLQKAHLHRELDWISSPEGRMCGLHSRKPAEGLHNMLFLCPSCHGENVMKSGNDAISCGKCGYSVTVDSGFNLSPRGGDPVMGDIRSWHSWQKAFWSELVRKRSECAADILTAECPSVKSAPINGSKAARIGQGPALLRSDGIYFSGIDGGQKTIPLADIQVCHCYKFAPSQDNRLLIRTGKEFYILELSEPNSPALSWELAVNALR